MLKKTNIIAILCFLSLSVQATKVILIIQPGTLLGYSSALLLNELAKQLPKPLNSYFNLIGGCSTGAIIASLLRVKNDLGDNKFTTADIIGKYLSLGPIIFNRELNRQQRTNELKNALKNSLGEVKLNQLTEKIALLVRKTKGQLNRDELSQIDQREQNYVEEFLTKELHHRYPDAKKYSIEKKKEIEASVKIEARAEGLKKEDREIISFDNSFPIFLYQGVFASGAKADFEPAHLSWDGSGGINTFDDAAAEGMNTTVQMVAYAQKLYPGEDLIAIDIGVKEDFPNLDYPSFLKKYFPSLNLRYFALAPKYKSSDFDIQFQVFELFLQENPGLIETIKNAIIR